MQPLKKTQNVNNSKKVYKNDCCVELHLTPLINQGNVAYFSEKSIITMQYSFENFLKFQWTKGPKNEPYTAN